MPFIRFAQMQVALPALHISLGIFDRLYKLYEDACHNLDIKLATTETTAPAETKEAFLSYAAQQKEIKQLNRQMEECLHKAERYHEVAVQLALYLEEDDENKAAVGALLEEAKKETEDADSLVNNHARHEHTPV